MTDDLTALRSLALAKYPFQSVQEELATGVLALLDRLERAEDDRDEWRTYAEANGRAYDSMKERAKRAEENYARALAGIEESRLVENAFLNMQERAERAEARLTCDRGCHAQGGPDEECSAHGRTPRELWEFIAQDIVGRDAAFVRAELAEAEAAEWRDGTILVKLAEAEAMNASLQAVIDGREASPEEWSLLGRLERAEAAIERCRAVLKSWEAIHEGNRRIIDNGIGIGMFESIDCVRDLAEALDTGKEDSSAESS